jgi:LPS sulfotransferase NodH
MKALHRCNHPTPMTLLANPRAAKMRHLARKMLLTSHSDYTRFVILARSRVGSNLLRGLLNSNPQIAAFGETFRSGEVFDWDHLGQFQSEDFRRLIGRDPVTFLQDHVFGLYPRSIKAVGFKLFYYHAQQEPFSSVWPYLRDQRDLHIIHLKRRNILETHVSRKRAARNDQWVNTNGTREKDVALVLDYAECLEDFTRTRGWESQYDDYFREHPLIEVVYEDMATNYQAEMNRIHSFLNIPSGDVRPSTFKQASEPLSQGIANYKDLKERFSGTPWQAFFAE